MNLIILKTLFSLALGAFSAHGQASKANGCFFEGKAFVAMHGCKFLKLDTAGMTLAVQKSCRNICDEEAREGVKAAAILLKREVHEVCSAGRCSIESLGYANGCLASLSKALALIQEIEDESRRSNQCKPSSDLTS